MAVLPNPDAKIVVVEDDAAMRDSLARAIAGVPSFDLVAACATFAAGAQAIAQHEIDVLVTDLRLPDGNGIDLIRAARDKQRDTEVMVISVLGDEVTVVAAIAAGASGFLLKDAQKLDVVAAIRDLLDGKSPISTAVARYIIKLAQESAGAQAPVAEVPQVQLTERELDILWGIAKGFTYRDVAERLGLSHNTIPTHIKNIYRKLEVNSRGEAVFEAIQLGLIDLSER